MKREYWLLLIITVIGLFLRFASLTIGFTLQGNLDVSLFPDEANFLVNARYFYLGEFPPSYLYYHNSLILSPLISGLYSLFGVTAFSGRFISALLGTLTIPVMYFLGKELFKNEKKALLTALLLSVSFIHRFWTIRALADGPLTFFFVLSLYLFMRAIHKEDWRLYILAGISTTITVLIKYPGILVYLVVFFYIVISIYLKHISKKALLYYLVTIGIFAFTAITLFLSQFALAFQPIDQIFNFLEILFSGASNPLFYIFYSLFLDIVWALLIFAILAVVLFYSIKQHGEADVFILSWLAVVFIFFSFFGESELYRYLLPAIPAVYLLISNFFIDLIKKFNFSIRKFKFSKNSSVAFILLIILGGFATTELIIGENLIVKRSTTYSGIHYMSMWLNANGTQSAGIMAPSNAMAQIDFYTNNTFKYFELSRGETEAEIYNYVQSNNISYIILSEHFPETLSFKINSFVPSNATYYTLNFSYSDDSFKTWLYTVN